MKKINTITTSLQGTVQGSQIPKALDPGYFQVDERDKAQLMAFCAKFAGALDYYNLQDKRDGTWDSFLLADVTVLTALIAGTNPEPGFEKFIRFEKGMLAATGWKTQKLFAQRFFNTGFDAVLVIDQWYKLSAQNFSSNILKEYLNDQIRREGSEALNAFYSFYFHLSENLPAFRNEALARFKILDAAWDFNPFPQTQRQDVNEGNREDFLRQAVQHALDAGQRLFAIQVEIVNYAKVEFLNSLERSDMPAHIGLLSAFMDLFANHQRALNTLTKKHLDFYYRSVLGFNPGKALPDSTYITFQLAPAQQEVIIPEESAFAAGKDEHGNTIEFVSNESVKINATQISSYRTLNFVPEEKSSLLRGIYTGQVTKFNISGNDRWPFWGSDSSTANLAANPAILGFAFSSPDLLLAEGVRNITITLALTTESIHAIEVLERSAGDINTVLPSFFEVQFTTPGEWKAGIISSMVYDHAGTLSITINLPVGYPAITCYQAKAHGPGFTSVWPMCKMMLTYSGKKYYNTLQKLAFNSVAISTTATGVSGLVVENDAGKLAASGTFIPFQDPGPGTSLYCGGREFFVKPMEYVRLAITWEKLPESFKHYYEGYNDYYAENSIPFQFENQVFEATVSVLANGEWRVITDINKKPLLYALFTADATTTTNEAPLVPGNEKIIEINGANIPHNAELDVFTTLSPSLTEGFFKLTFTNPEEGFGTIDYPAIVSDVTLANSVAALHNARVLVFKKKKIRPYPNVPYIPKIAHLEISYKSVNHWDIGPSATTLQWYHMHPFGTEQVSFGSGAVSLLPVYEYAANVYLGLSAVTPGDLLSVFISITTQVKSVTSSVSQGLAYAYFSTGGWKALPVSEDTTEGFQKSGIMRFVLPDDFSTGNPLLPDSLCWIRCSCINGDDVTTDFITTQAIRVSRRSDPGENVTPVPGGTVLRPVLPIPGLQSIVQPVPSAGGRAVQTETQFNNTVASRLRYKRRAVSLKDMEDLVLQQFPELFNVTAVPEGYYHTASSGIIKVVVVPFTSCNDALARQPYASAALMLEVRKYLSSISLPFTTFEITNPDFDTLEVQCSVKFMQAYDQVKGQIQLQDDIGNFLSPWIMDNPLQKDIPKLYTSSALYSFIKTRPYIQYVSAFGYSLLTEAHREDYVMTVGSAPAQPGNAIIKPVNPWSLVIPANKHEIKIVNNSGQQVLSSSPAALEGLRIGETFYLTN